MGPCGWPGRTLLSLALVALLCTAAHGADPPLGVVFVQPTSGAIVSGTTVAILFESFGGSDPDGDSFVQRRFVLDIDGTTVSDTTSTFPANHQESAYAWTLAGVADGPHRVQVTAFDEAGSSATSERVINVANGTAGVARPVVWASPVKVAVDGSTITKNAGCDGCSDAGAISQQTIASGDGAVQFTVSPKAYLTVGLGTGNVGTDANEIAFGLRFYPGNLVEVRESGVYKADWTYANGATHGVAVEGGAVKYFLNGALKYTSAQAPTYPLLLDTALWTIGAAVQNATITTGAGGATVPPGGTPPPGAGPVVWTNAVNGTVTGNTVAKSGGCDGCFDAGAVSQQLISTGTGSVSFTTPANAFLVVGLSNGNPGTSGNEIKFGLRFYPGSPGIVEVRESGAYKWDWLNAAGAVHKIAVEAGVVKYYQNGVLKYTSATAPSLPLLLDTALGSSGSAVQNAVIGP